MDKTDDKRITNFPTPTSSSSQTEPSSTTTQWLPTGVEVRERLVEKMRKGSGRRRRRRSRFYDSDGDDGDDDDDDDDDDDTPPPQSLSFRRRSSSSNSNNSHSLSTDQCFSSTGSSKYYNHAHTYNDDYIDEYGSYPYSYYGEGTVITHRNHDRNRNRSHAHSQPRHHLQLQHQQHHVVPAAPANSKRRCTRPITLPTGSRGHRANARMECSPHHIQDFLANDIIDNGSLYGFTIQEDLSTTSSSSSTVMREYEIVGAMPMCAEVLPIKSFQFQTYHLQSATIPKPEYPFPPTSSSSTIRVTNVLTSASHDNRVVAQFRSLSKHLKVLTTAHLPPSDDENDDNDDDETSDYGTVDHFVDHLHAVLYRYKDHNGRNHYRICGLKPIYPKQRSCKEVRTQLTNTLNVSSSTLPSFYQWGEIKNSNHLLRMQFSFKLRGEPDLKFTSNHFGSSLTKKGYMVQANSRTPSFPELHQQIEDTEEAEEIVASSKLSFHHS
eukprot:CAMPEP_0119553244 /NCGR_PEP_ID=MMETSP1352-20130426/6020_1 /TAXON_ID=265584 /ORGANISM="Stauroneis constricta, Strain CCMP1120" /LENGTH=493 /DNA_ID=CAMNT_0007599605 /DNA_START=84 /DNA_END=1566 /DNA_ORIENTATION=+